MSVFLLVTNGSKGCIFKKSVWSFKYAWAFISPESGMRCPFHEAKVLIYTFASPKPSLATTNGLISSQTHAHTNTHTFLCPSHPHVRMVGSKLSVFCLKVPQCNLSLLWYSDSLHIFILNHTHTQTHTAAASNKARLAIILIPNCHWIIYANVG